jgi:hypothetical protein
MTKINVTDRFGNIDKVKKRIEKNIALLISGDYLNDLQNKIKKNISREILDEEEEERRRKNERLSKKRSKYIPLILKNITADDLIGKIFFFFFMYSYRKI